MSSNLISIMCDYIRVPRINGEGSRPSDLMPLRALGVQDWAAQLDKPNVDIDVRVVHIYAA